MNMERDKLENNDGVRGLPLKLLASYLSDRKQAAVFSNHNLSHLTTIIKAVPQGSILLGPMIFLVYSNK